MKVKNLYWDEIQPTYEETCPTWFRDDPVRAVPTQEDLREAEKAIDIAQAEYDDADAAGLDVTEPLIELRCAIEAFRDLSWRREQAILKEGPICPLT